MAHPKRRTSKSAKGLRRSHLSIQVAKPTHCGRCGAANRSHRVCENCGYYGLEKGGGKGTEVLVKEEF